MSDDLEPELPDAGAPDGLPPGDAPGTNRPEARERPDDPAGTKPRHDPSQLEPRQRPVLSGRLDSTAVEGYAVELDADDGPQPADADLLPEKTTAGALGGYTPSETKHTPRFQFLLGALFAMGLAAVAALVALAIQGEPDRPIERPWSAWKPLGDDPPAEIAEHVGQRYHQENGDQLVLVKGGPLEVSDTPLKIVLSQGGNYYPVDGQAVMYNLCGLGGNCRIKSGKPSEERLLLLRRASLELALYTFRYTDAENVVAIFPPTANKTTGKFKKQQDLAVFLQRKDLEEQIERPVDTTLTSTPPRVSTILKSPDIASVQSITTPRRFNVRLLSGGTDGAYIVLQKIG
jgi:hypothetical protein